MTGSEGHQPGVWQQLRNRRVTRTVVAYLCVAFAVFEAVSSVAPRLALGVGVVRAILGTVVLGFPFAVVLAWTYDITPQGIVRTPDHGVSDVSSTAKPSIRRLLWLLVCAGGLVLGLVLRALRP